MGACIFSTITSTTLQPYKNISNEPLLGFLYFYEVSFPSEYVRAVRVFTASKRPIRALKKHTPSLLKTLLALAQGNERLLLGTLRSRTVNSCIICGEPTRYHDKASWIRTCSSKCSKVIASNTMCKRYGKAHALQVPSFRRKQRATMMREHGVRNASKSKLLMDKARESMIRKYGVPHALQSSHILTRMWDAYETRTGYSHNSKNPKVKKAKIATNQRERGCDNPTQDPAIFEKAQRNALGAKTFVESNGKVHRVRGYEPRIISWLNDRGVTGIVTRARSLPVIALPGEGMHVYHPDMRFRNTNGQKILLEVKSTYTLWKDWGKNKVKFRAASEWCVRHGYIFVLAVAFESRSKDPLFVSWPTASKVHKVVSLDE